MSARFRLLVLAAALLPASGAFAQGLLTLEFSFSNPGARSLGFGGAFVALADDATAGLCQPGGTGPAHPSRDLGRGALMELLHTLCRRRPRQWGSHGSRYRHDAGPALGRVHGRLQRALVSLLRLSAEALVVGLLSPPAGPVQLDLRHRRTLRRGLDLSRYRPPARPGGLHRSRGGQLGLCRRSSHHRLF